MKEGKGIPCIIDPCIRIQAREIISFYVDEFESPGVWGRMSWYEILH
jgi:hypothetical protein